MPDFVFLPVQRKVTDSDQLFLQELATDDSFRTDMYPDWNGNKFERFKIVIKEGLIKKCSNCFINFRTYADQNNGERKLEVTTVNPDNNKKCNVIIDLGYVLSNQCDINYPFKIIDIVYDKIKSQKYTAVNRKVRDETKRTKEHVLDVKGDEIEETTRKR